MMDEIKKPSSKMWIVGINLLILVLYTALSRIVYQADGWGLAFLCIAAQVVICLLLSFVFLLIPEYRKRWLIWFFSAIMILLIGFSTCVSVFTIKI